MNCFVQANGGLDSHVRLVKWPFCTCETRKIWGLNLKCFWNNIAKLCYFVCFPISHSFVIVLNVVTFELVFQSLNELTTHSCELFYVNLPDTLVLAYLNFMLITIGIMCLVLIHGSMTHLGFYLYHFMDCKYKGIKREMAIILASMYYICEWLLYRPLD